MKRWIVVIALVGLAFVAMAAATTRETAAQRALSPRKEVADRAIAESRAMGQPGVDALVKAGEAERDQARYRAALDRVCRQRDCAASRLFWYTDLDGAKAAAKAQGKPILSLRLLGNLDDDLSCANSRFFRTTLYANQKIARTLRDQFVLHWSSERPVLKVTIDFGEGRKLCRTVTGNSVHYLLDADGNVLDALPGLYSPHAFLVRLETLQRLAVQYAGVDVRNRPRFLRQYHARQYDFVMADRQAELQRIPDIQRVAVKADPRPEPMATLVGNRQTYELKNVTYTPISAAAAAIRTESKMASERVILSAVGQPIDEIAVSDWKRIAANHIDEVAFDEASIALMKEKAAGGDAWPDMLARLARTVAEDTVRDEYDFHLRIHQWLANAPTQPAFDALNKRIYAELFLTPASDPWLGLLQNESFSAIDGGGVVTGSR